MEQFARSWTLRRAGWSVATFEGTTAAAAARVVTVTVAGDRAEVAQVVNGGYEYWAYFVRDEQDWLEAGNGNGPSIDWAQPSALEW